MLKNKDTVIFDLDGTLVDSMGMWEDVDRRFFAERKIPYPEDIQILIAGMSIVETAEFFKKNYPLTESIDELISIWNEMAYDEYHDIIEMKAGALDFLKYLKSKNIKMGLATSNSRTLVNACFEKHSLHDYISVIVTADEVPHGKPEPDIYLEACKKLDSDPANCLVFEDMLQGIMAGKRAGMSVCGINDNASEVQETEKKEEADYYINDYYEIDEVKEFAGI